MNSLNEHPGFRAILAAVSDAYGVKPSELLNRRRTEPLASARFAAAYITREHLRRPFSEIAGAFGRAGQNWAILACQTFKQRLAYEQSTKAKILAANLNLQAKRGPLYGNRAA